MLLKYGIASIIIGIFTLLVFSDAGPTNVPLFQRALYASPFIVFGVWVFYDEYRSWRDMDEGAIPKSMQFVILLLTVAGVCVFAYSSSV